MKWEISDLEFKTSATSVGRENRKIYKSTNKTPDFVLVVGCKRECIWGIYLLSLDSFKICLLMCIS